MRNQAKVRGHPNIISVKGHYINKQKEMTLIFPYYEGGDLNKYIETMKSRNSPIPKLQVLKMSKQIIEAVHHCHKNGVIHKDIKPHNIIMNQDGNVLLGDFGVSRDEAALDVHRTRQTTPFIKCPELIASGEKIPGTRRAFQFKYNHKIDIWAVGITLYMILELEHPFGMGRHMENNIVEKEP